MLQSIVDFDKPTDGLFLLGGGSWCAWHPAPARWPIKAGLKHGYVLFNYLSNEEYPFAQKDGDLFKNFSKNNQVILVPKSFKECEQDAIKWIVYASFAEGYKLTKALNAAFDFSGPKPYYVPTACAQCHGHDEEFGAPLEKASGEDIFPFGRVNFLYRH